MAPRTAEDWKILRYEAMQLFKVVFAIVAILMLLSLVGGGGLGNWPILHER